ncbi:hypothetical protein RJT34_23705 [Clitoria ternatea]|uniref:Uncharacterized protein n=1 Tax=Clitoria ternatea TaxID=43366 RepID=A0AAN9FST1_CLITE
MPKVDLETLQVSACAGGSAARKIAADEPDSPEAHPDSPPESFWLSGDAEYDWWDRNAVYERKDSTRGNSISTNSNSNSNSQRFSKNLKSKATIIGFPKPQKTSFAEAKSRRNYRPPGNARLFPKRSASVGGKSETAAVIEPLSPKVSCIGRVRSKRDRNRRLRIRQRSISSSVASSVAPVVVMRQKSSRSQRKKTGFFESVRAIFRSGRRGKPVQKTDVSPEDSSTSKKRKNQSRKARGSSSNTATRNDASFEESVSSEPRGLGSVNRFASGRRSESWGVGEL